MPQLLSQQAVFLAKTESFQRWIDRVEGKLDRTTDEHQASLFIKFQCCVKSRRQFDQEPEAAVAFEMLLRRYRTDRDYWGLPDDEIALQKKEMTA